MRILITGLPGCGKSTLAEALKKEITSRCNELKVAWINADNVRKLYDDWDFSLEGRERQAYRMKKIADESTANIVLIDMVAPLEKYREIIDAEIVIYMDTKQPCRYEDTEAIYEVPKDPTIIISSFSGAATGFICDILGYK